MQSGNARIHGMRAVTKASLAYVVTQVWLNVVTFYMLANSFPGECRPALHSPPLQCFLKLIT